MKPFVKTILCFTIAALFQCFRDSYATDLVTEPVTVEGACSKKSMEITFTIKNNSDHELVLPTSDVPWLFVHSVNLVLAETNFSSRTARIINMVKRLEDPPVGFLTIGSHTNATGSINLRHFFPSLHQTLQTNNVLVYWRYVIHQSDSAKDFRGCLLLKSEIN